MSKGMDFLRGSIDRLAGSIRDCEGHREGRRFRKLLRHETGFQQHGGEA